MMDDLPESLFGTRPLQAPAHFRVPPHVFPIVMKNNVALAQKPQSPPPSPQIAKALIGTADGFQFAFDQVTLPAGATNTITVYRIYRNTTNVFNKNLIHTIAHDPTHIGAVTFTDTIMANTGGSYFYWVTAVDSTGQESTPQAAQCGSTVGNIGSTPFSNTTGFSYTSTTTSITWFWDGTNGSTTLKIYRGDGTVTGPISGNQTITGLSPSTTYNFYPYWDDTTQTVQWVAGGSGTPAYAQPSAGSNVFVQSQNLRTRIPLSLGGMQASTPAAGGGGGTGGGGGGGGSCFSGNVRIRTLEGLKRFDELPLDKFEIVNLTGIHPAELIVHEYSGPMLDMGERQLVTPAHKLMDGANEWITAKEFFPYAVPERLEGRVYNLRICSDDARDFHYVLENGVVAHNLNKN